MKIKKTLTQLRFEALEVAHKILSGQYGILEGVRIFSPMVWKIEIELDAKEDEFSVLRGILSEAEEEFPDPKTKENWNNEAWMKQNEGLTQYEASIKEIVQKACKRFIEKYGSL